MRLDKVVLATRNPKKLRELRRVLDPAVDVVGIDEFPAYPEPEETERTFEGNARIKALAGLEHTGLPTLADDSGLQIEELNDMPGVRSARWAGPECDDEANLHLVLRQLHGVPWERRLARFTCVLALALPGGQVHVWHGHMPGHITTEPVGDNGFGYDPIFQPSNCDVTSAQLQPAEKDALSHRGKALREFRTWVHGE